MSPGVSPAITGGGQTLPPIKVSTELTSPRKKESTCPNTPQNQIHSYHKLFWRLNITLEFNIFHQADRQLYEVAAYHSEKEKEYDPLYFHEDAIMKLCVTPEALNGEIQAIKLKCSKDRFSEMPSVESLTQMAKVSLFKKCMEAHLNPKPDGTLTFLPLPGEAIDVDSLMFKLPEEQEIVSNNDETPVEDVEEGAQQEKSEQDKTSKSGRRRTVVRRQRSSMTEFNKNLSLLKQNSMEAQQASKIAENMLSLSELSVNAFKNALKKAGGNNTRNPGFYNKKTPLGLFRWAVHRVILQMYVEAVRKRIDELNKKKAIRINGTFPVPGSTDMQSQQAKILSLAGRLSANPQMQSLSESLSREGSRSGTPRVTKKEKNLIAHSNSLPTL